MNWYLQSGRDSDVVISTKVSFSRNLQGFKFNLKNKSDIEKLKSRIKENIYAIGYGLKYFELKDIDDITKKTLVEKKLISSKMLLANNKEAAILMNEEENICIMINEEDHLKIQVFSAGFELENTLNFAIELDKKIEEILGYVTSSKYGYLTTSPTMCGTGLKASVTLHLPALEETNNIGKVIYTINNYGLNTKVGNENGEKNIGSIYKIVNKRTLGITEKEIAENIKIIAEKLIEQEREARRSLTKKAIDLEDRISRSYGILSNCKKITLEETSELLSDVKLGTDLGILTQLTDSKVQKLYLYTKSANMQKYAGEQLEGVEKDIKRAEIIKNIINEK